MQESCLASRGASRTPYAPRVHSVGHAAALVGGTTVAANLCVLPATVVFVETSAPRIKSALFLRAWGQMLLRIPAKGKNWLRATKCNAGCGWR